MQPEPPFFVYDGDCGFCRKWMHWLIRRVDGGAVTTVPFQDIDDLGAFGLREVGVSTASYWVAEDGRTHRGPASFAKVLRLGRGPWRAAGLLLGLPVIRHLAGVAYWVIARNRHRLPAPG